MIVYADAKRVSISLLGKVSATLTTNSIAQYLNKLNNDGLLWHMDDSIDDVSFVNDITDKERMQMKLAQLQIWAWQEQNNKCVFELYPSNLSAKNRLHECGV